MEMTDEDLKALIAASEAATPAWGVWVDYTLAPRGSYACLMSSFVNGKWTDPESRWMSAHSRPPLKGQHRVMPYLMPGDPLAEQPACNSAAAMARELLALREALERADIIAEQAMETAPDTETLGIITATRMIWQDLLKGPHDE